jgi:tetratricopeptide (TPR) repeat protein
LSYLSSRDRRLFLAIVLVALVLRIAYLADVRNSPYFHQPLLDSYWYDAKAQAVLQGDLLSRTGTFRVPLYTYFLAGSYLIFGHAFMPPLVLQALLGAFTCGLLYVIARRLFGRLAGAFAGFGLAIYRMAIYSDGELLPTTLFMALVLASVYFILNGLERARLRDGLLAGLFLGLAFLTRPEVLVLAVGLGIVIVALRREKGFRVVVPMGIVLLGTMMLLGVRNREASGEFFLFSPQGAVNLYIGNARYADGKTPVAPSTRFPYAVTADPSEDSIILGCKQAALESTGRDLDDRELARYYTRKTFQEILDDVPRWLGLVGRKTYYFLNSYELSDIKLIPRFIQKYTRVLNLPLLGYSIVMPLGLVGLGLAVARRNRAAWVLIAGFAACALTTVAFFVVWRFRLPAVPFLLALGGLAVSELVAAARARAWRPLVFMALPAIILGLVSLSSFWGVRTEAALGTYISNEGALLALEGKTGQAIEVYKEAIAADPRDARPYYYMGKAYGSLGLVAQSKEALDQAMAVNPNYGPFALLSMGKILYEHGSYADAAAYFGRAVAADPGFAMAYYNLGLSMLRLGRSGEAEKALFEAQRLAGDDSNIVLSAARILIEMGHTDDGIAAAEAVLRKDPRNAGAFFTLGAALEKQGRLPEALGQYEIALKYWPTSQEIRQKVMDLRAGMLRR